MGVHDPRCVHDQDAYEACDQGGQAGDLRQGGDGEGQAGQDHRESLRGGGIEEGGLSSAMESGQLVEWLTFATEVISRGGPEREALGVFEAACAWGARAVGLYMSVCLRHKSNAG